MYAIYARQSLDKKDSISIESQIEFCKRECNDNDFKVYFDKGFSGSNIERPQFQELLKDVKANKITKIIVYRLDRMSRSLLDFSELVELFNSYNVEFVSCTEKFDTSTPIGRAMLSIVMVFAQLERETIQQRVKDNYYERCKRGMFGGGGVPYGFDYKKILLNNKKASVLIKNEVKAKIVQRIYEMYANDEMTLGQICKALNEEKIPTENSGKGWTSNVLSRILKSGSYVRADENVYRYLEYQGCLMANDISEYDGTRGVLIFGNDSLNKFKDLNGYVAALGLHEGFINSNLWIKVHNRAYNNKQINPNTGNSKTTWLAGISKCGKCGYAMTYKASKKGKKEYKYLRCSGTTYNYCDRKTFFNLEEIENEVIQMIFEHIKNNKKNYIAQTNIEIDNEINSIKIELLSIDKKIENLVSKMMEAEDIAMSYINKALVELDQRKSVLLKQLETTNTKQNVSDTFDLKTYMKKWPTMELEEKKRFVNNYVNEIIINEENIDITFKK